MYYMMYLLPVIPTMNINAAIGIKIAKHRFHFEIKQAGIVRSLNIAKGNSIIK